MLTFAVGFLSFLMGWIFGALFVYRFWRSEMDNASSLIERAREDGVRAAIESMGGVSSCCKDGNHGDDGAPQPLPMFLMKCKGCVSEAGCPVVFGVAADEKNG